MNDKPGPAAEQQLGADNAPAEPHSLNASGEIPSAEEQEKFDPYAFSALPVSPELRREMIQAKLPRLDPEYFQDTLPPTRGLDAATVGLAADREETRLVQRRTSKRPNPQTFKLVVAAVCLVAAALVVVALWKKTRSEVGSTETDRLEQPHPQAEVGHTPTAPAAMAQVVEGGPLPPPKTTLGPAASSPSNSVSSPMKVQAVRPVPTAAAPPQTSWLKPR